MGTLAVTFVLLSAAIAAAVTTTTVPLTASPGPMAVDSSRGRVYALIGSNQLATIDEASNSQVATVSVGADPDGVGVDETQNKVFVANRQDNTVSVVDASTESVVATLPVGSQPEGIGVDPGTARAYVANWNSATVSIIDTSSNAIVSTLAAGSNPARIVVDPTIHRAFVGDDGDRTILVIDTTTDQAIDHVQVADGVGDIAVNPLKNRLYVRGLSQLTIFDTTNDGILSTSPLPSSGWNLVDNPTSGRLWMVTVNNPTPCSGGPGQCVAAFDDSTGALDTLINIANAEGPIAVDPVRNTVWQGTPGAALVGFQDVGPFPPTPPQNVQASFDASTSQITIHWSPPAGDGGAPITNYQVGFYSSDQPSKTVSVPASTTTYTDAIQGSCSQTHVYVVAVNAGGWSGASSYSLAAAQLPSQPTGLQAFPLSGRVRLNWTAPAQAGSCPIIGYKVWTATNSGPRTLLANTGSTSPGFEDTRAHDSGTTYDYWVTATNAAGDGQLSDELAFTYPNRPSPPLSLVASTGPDRGQISLSWTPPVDTGGLPILQYNVYRGTTSGGEASSIYRIVPSGTSFVDYGLPDGASYYYVVTALTAAGEGARSIEAKGTTPVLPSAPTNVTASPGPSVGQIALHWSPPVNNGGVSISGYRIYRNGSFVIQVTGTQWTDSKLQLLTSYHYTITAVNAAGEGPASAPVCARAFPWNGKLGC